MLHVLAGTGQALEVNTRLGVDPLLVDWWRQEGGAAVSFGSDVHDPQFLAQGFTDAVEVVGAGYRPGNDPRGFWTLR